MNTTLTIFRAERLLERLGGLLARPALNAGEALYLSPCTSVHTCGMSYPIDIAFVDRELHVLQVVRHLKPWRATICGSAHGAFEFQAGELQQRGIRVGDVIQGNFQGSGS